MGLVAGIDGCRAGWAVVLAEANPLRLKAVQLIGKISELDDLNPPPDIISIDIPIGLDRVAKPGGRACDAEARALLKPHRTSSVFSPPCQAALGATDYEEAKRVNRASGPDAPGLSQQTFNLFPKIREVAEWVALRPASPVFESHPEVSFTALNNGKPLAEPKRKQAGRARRLALLSEAGLGGIETYLSHWPLKLIAPDDLIDAAIMAWTANRLLSGSSVRLGGSEDHSLPAIHY
ncbi:MAG: DUF429 domain-containing protein [Magnetovibrionaceae bacterium]